MEITEKEIVEEWRSVDGYEKLYEVSSLGRVRSCDRFVYDGKGGTRLLKGRILKPQMRKNGYLQVGLSKDGKYAMFKLHHLVANAFSEICGEYMNDLEIEHKNCIRTDNRATNLRWCTHKENCNNSITRQRYYDANKGEKSYWYGKSGKLNPMWGKFGKNNSNSIPIIQYSTSGVKIAEFEGLMDAERKLGIRCTAICNALKGRRKTAGGVKWVYKE